MQLCRRIIGAISFALLCSWSQCESDGERSMNLWPAEIDVMLNMKLGRGNDTVCMVYEHSSVQHDPTTSSFVHVSEC